jgi:hypothetical protein
MFAEKAMERGFPGVAADVCGHPEMGSNKMNKNIPKTLRN